MTIKPGLSPDSDAAIRADGEAMKLSSSYVFGGVEIVSEDKAWCLVKRLSDDAVIKNAVINRVDNPYYDGTTYDEQKTLSLDVVAQQVISNVSSSNQAISLLAETYLESVANSIFSTDQSKQFVKLTDLLSQLEANKTLRT